MSTSTTAKHVQLLADALDADPAWVGSMLARLGVEVTAQGFYEPADVRRAFDRGARPSVNTSEISSLPPEIMRTMLTITEMGADQDGCFTWLKKQFLEHGLKVTGRGGTRNLVTFTLERADGEQMKISVHAALRLKEKTGQVGFSVSGFECEDLTWFAFVAKPWGRAYLRNRKDIEKRKRSDKRSTKTAFLTFSPGVTHDLFDKRIGELIADDAAWGLRRKLLAADRERGGDLPPK